MAEIHGEAHAYSDIAHLHLLAEGFLLVTVMCALDIIYMGCTVPHGIIRNMWIQKMVS